MRWIVFLVAITVVAFAARPYVRGASFVVRAADMHGVPRQLADRMANDAREREIDIATGAAPLHARVYEPSTPSGRVALLVPPPGAAGFDAPAVAAIARQLASSGVTVVAPAIAELLRVEITPAVTAAIEQAALAVASDATLTSDGTVAVIGFGVSGGLSVVAAGRPGLADRVAYVVSIGGHHDLPRVFRYLCTGTEPRPSNQIQLKANTTEQDAAAFVRPPSMRGAAVLLLGVAHRLVPPAQVDPLRAAVRQFLATLPTDGAEPPHARAVRTASDSAPQLAEPSATLLRYLAGGDIVHLGARMLPHTAAYGSDPSLSPSRSPKPSAPVFLLHDTSDAVVPEVEAEYLAEELRGHAPVRLVTGRFSGASPNDPLPLTQAWKLAGFWGDVLSR